MAGSRIKGIAVEIGGDTTKLQTALKGVNSEIKNTQSQLKDVEKLLKLDPGNPPYGYIWKDGEIQVDPTQAEIIKRIFRELLSGKGTEAIAKELNQEQIPTKKGGHWTSSSIRGIIKNEKYTGDCIFQKTYTDSNFNRHKNDGHLDQKRY